MPTQVDADVLYRFPDLRMLSHLLSIWSTKTSLVAGCLALPIGI